MGIKQRVIQQMVQNWSVLEKSAMMTSIESGGRHNVSIGSQIWENVAKEFGNLRPAQVYFEETGKVYAFSSDIHRMRRQSLSPQTFTECIDFVSVLGYLRSSVLRLPNCTIIWTEPG